MLTVFQSPLPHGSDRQARLLWTISKKFQSPLPHGSDGRIGHSFLVIDYFNPRSLTGATAAKPASAFRVQFQSPLPHGSDLDQLSRDCLQYVISIPAPSRERLYACLVKAGRRGFQSPLPHGSDNMFMSPS